MTRKRCDAITDLADHQKKIPYFWTTDRKPQIVKELADLKLPIKQVTSSGRHYGVVTSMFCNFKKAPKDVLY